MIFNALMRNLGNLGNYLVYSHEHKGAKHCSAIDCKLIILEYTG